MLNELFLEMVHEKDIDEMKKIVKKILNCGEDLEGFFLKKLNRVIEILKSDKESDEEFYVLDIIYFLCELDSEKSLDLILESLRFDERTIYNEFGDVLNETLWRVFVKLGRNDIDKLIKFSKDEKVISNCRFVVLMALSQMCSDTPERKEELKELIEKLISDETEDEYLRLLLVELADDLGMKKLKNVCKNILDSIDWVPETIDEYLFIEKDFSHFKEYNIYDYIEEYRKYTPEIQEEMLEKMKKLHETELMYADFHEPRHVVKVGRNDPCPCGSGKKYKKCCGK